MTKLASIAHHELDEQLFFTWLWCGYHDIIRQAHDFTLCLDKRLKQRTSPFLAQHEANRHLWRAITRLPSQLGLEETESTTIILARLTKKAPLFLLIYQGLWLENRLAYAQEAASAALLFYFYYEQASIGHQNLMRLHTQLSQWIIDTLNAQRIEEGQIKSLLLFYFHDYTAKTIQQHQTLPQPPIITLLKHELIALCEDSKKNQAKMFGSFSPSALQTVSAICPHQRQHRFLMTFLDAIARAYVYAAYKNTMEQMLACEQGTLIQFLLLPIGCCVGLISSLFFKLHLPLLQLALFAFCLRHVIFFFSSHAFDHYYNAQILVDYLYNWTPTHSDEGFRYWHHTLRLDTRAFACPETVNPEKIAQRPSTPEYWYPGNYTRVIYHRLRVQPLKPAPTISEKMSCSTEILTWCIHGAIYSNHSNNNAVRAFAIDQPNLPANAPIAYYAAIHPTVAERLDTQPFQRLLEGRLRFVGETGAGVKMLKKNLFELKTVGSQGKNDARMISDPHPYSANERKTAHLLLFSQARMNHTHLSAMTSLNKNSSTSWSLPPILR